MSIIIKPLFVSLSLFVFCVFNNVKAQCPYPTSNFGAGTAPTPGNSVTIETCNFVGEYATVGGVVAGNDYTVTYSGGAGTYLVIYDNTTTPVFWGASPLSFTAPTPGTYYTASFLDAACSDFDPTFSCNSSLWSNDTPLPPPVNDEPCSAIAITVASNCSYTSTTNLSATPSSGVTAPGCAGYLGGDVWYTVTVPASGKVLIDTQTGVILDGGMAIYTGICGSLTLLECDDDDSPNGAMPSILVTSEPAGTILLVRVWEVGNNDNGSFGICAQEIATCGTPLTNDYCASPAQLTQAPGSSWSSSTDATYSTDIPGNLLATFCGSIENNSWYQFTAASTSETFNFTSISGCVSNQGIQAAVYSIAYDINNCCDILTLSSNCYSPTTATPGTVTAPFLTIGNQYVLIVDGFSGDECDFTVSDWTATGVLPIELSKFNGVALNDFNALRWETASELNNDYFSIERSYNGIDFESIGIVNSKGNSQTTKYYQFDDFAIRYELMYYRLKQVDFDGKSTLSEIISVKRSSDKTGLLSVYPNPTNENIFVEINGENGIAGSLTIKSLTGEKLISKNIYTEKIQNHLVDLKLINSGVYFIEYNDSKAFQTIKFIKN